MKFLILNTDYFEFLCWLYAQYPGLEEEPYERQMQVRMESLFGVADFYSSNLRKLGYEADDIHANNEFMQKAWAREYGLRVERTVSISQKWREILQQVRRLAAKTPMRYLKPLFRPLIRSLDNQQSWFYEILAAQIKHYKPDIVLNQAMGSIDSRFLKEMKPYMRLLIGQIASPLPQGEDFSCYDLVISSLPNFVEYFRKLGIPSELNRFAFEPKVLERFKANNKATVSVSFVGSLFQTHTARVRWLEYLCHELDVKIWGTGIDGLPKNSLIRQCYMGKAWGVKMYQILRKSKITLNYHIDVAGPYANNMRLFEATGVGTLLITDWKKNLYEMFEPGKEVVTYRSPEECVELIRYYLKHDKEQEAIARAGQKRTLQEHTYYHRMQELVDIVHKYL
jgi:hypothetical protein